jgi:acyl carrier protein
MDNIEDSLHQYILTEFLPGESPEQLTAETPLRTSGIIDSMRLLKLVSRVEDEYDIELAAHETGIETFNTIKDIASLIRSKRK